MNQTGKTTVDNLPNALRHLRSLGVILKSIREQDVLLEDLPRLLRNIPSKIYDQDQLVCAMEAVACVVEKFSTDREAGLANSLVKEERSRLGHDFAAMMNTQVSDFAEQIKTQSDELKSTAEDLKQDRQELRQAVQELRECAPVRDSNYSSHPSPSAYTTGALGPRPMSYSGAASREALPATGVQAGQRAAAQTNLAEEIAKEKELKKLRLIMLDPVGGEGGEGVVVIRGLSESDIVRKATAACEAAVVKHAESADKEEPAERDISGPSFFSARKLPQGSVLLESRRQGAAHEVQTNAEFREIFNSSLKESDIPAVVKPKTYTLLVKFAPTHYYASDDPDFKDHGKVELANDLPMCFVVNTRWVKKPLHRSPRQQAAHLLVTLNSANTANQLLRQGAIIRYRKSCPVEKDQSEPLRCLQCQRYGHMAKACQQKDAPTCGQCGEAHVIKQCADTTKKHCVLCSFNNHSSSDRNCPAFRPKLCSHNLTHAANLMPFFPSTQNWTRCMTMENGEPPTLLPAMAEPSQRAFRQTTLTSMFSQSDNQLFLSQHDE